MVSEERKKKLQVILLLNLDVTTELTLGQVKSSKLGVHGNHGSMTHNMIDFMRIKQKAIDDVLLPFYH